MTLKTFNERRENFDYGYSEKSSKPSPITKKQILDKNQGFKQNASQMIQLITILPFIVTHFVPEVWPPLQNYIKMLEIIAISNANKIEVSSLNYLECSISEYLEAFQNIYKTSLTPKQHFLLHRPGRIVKYGPLKNYKTFRCESKHQYFKRISTRSSYSQKFTFNVS